jgi:hypothetical protein
MSHSPICRVIVAEAKPLNRKQGRILILNEQSRFARQAMKILMSDPVAIAMLRLLLLICQQNPMGSDLTSHRI